MSGSKHFSEVDFDGITFSDEDLKGVELPHNDALLVSMMVANAKVDKIFVTSGFGPCLLYLSTLEKVLGLSRNDILPVKQTVMGNYGEKIESIGTITLPVTAGDRPPRVRTFMVDFMVVDCPSVYDIIFGYRGLKALEAIASTYHLFLRFHTDAGVGEVRGDQKKARECEKALQELAERKASQGIAGTK
ncbi:hypothetical protein ACE6H2_002284 [Prunus campanulata]